MVEGEAPPTAAPQPPAPEEADESRPWEHLEELVAAGERRPVRLYLESLPSGDMLLAISRLPEDRQLELLTMLRPETAATLVEHLSGVHAVELVERLEPEAAAKIIQELSSSDQADLVGELEEEEREAILANLDPEEADQVRTLSEYGDHEAGGLMVTEFLAYPETATVGEVVHDFRSHRDEYSDYNLQYTYVVTPRKRLVGVLRLRDLLLAPEHRPLRDIMIRDPLRMGVHASLEELRDFFAERAILGVPIVDARDRLVGVVHRSELEAALGERSDEDFRKAQGLPAEELRTMPVFVRSRRRLAWLSINIVLNVLAASVIAAFESTLQAVIALAVFLPIISDMSGCSGNQAVAVSMRELTLGYLRPTELLRVWLKEISIGFINGTVLGLLIAAVAILWKGNAWLGLVVGLAMALNTMVAVSIGGLIPLVLKRLGKDPALASGPVLTTITDMCGFFFVLGMATVAMSKLTGG